MLIPKVRTSRKLGDRGWDKGFLYLLNDMWKYFWGIGGYFKKEKAAQISCGRLAGADADRPPHKGQKQKQKRGYFCDIETIFGCAVQKHMISECIWAYWVDRGHRKCSKQANNQASKQSTKHGKQTINATKTQQAQRASKPKHSKAQQSKAQQATYSGAKHSK